jgi:hypothetical protein
MGFCQLYKVHVVIGDVALSARKPQATVGYVDNFGPPDSVCGLSIPGGFERG